LAVNGSRLVQGLTDLPVDGGKAHPRGRSGRTLWRSAIVSLALLTLGRFRRFAASASGAAGLRDRQARPSETFLALRITLCGQLNHSAMKPVGEVK